MWAKAARWADEPQAGGAPADHEDDDGTCIGSPGASLDAAADPPCEPEREPEPGQLEPEPEPEPEGRGGLQRALRELSRARRSAEDPQEGAAAQSSGGRERRLLALLASGGAAGEGGAGSPASAAASFGSDEAYDMDDFEVADADSSGESEAGAAGEASPDVLPYEGEADVDRSVAPLSRSAAVLATHSACAAAAAWWRRW